MAAVDLNRGTTGVSLPASVADEVWNTASESSVVMRLATRIDLPGNGKTIPIISGDATAAWVAESDNKPVSRPTLSNKTISAYTLAVIVPFSNELRRDNAALYNTIVGNLPNALAKTFDRTVFGLETAPGSNFDTLAAAPAVSIDTADERYAAFLAALASTAGNGGDVSHWVLSTQGELAVLGEVGTDGRPLFTAGAADGGALGNILGRPVVRSKHVYFTEAEEADIVGFAGDWVNDARWGMVGGIDISISDQATLTDGGTQINLWQRNMSAARCEVEVGFRVTAVNRFAKLTGATPE